MEGMATKRSNKTVTIDQLDYGYIDKCSNEKELERILRTLRVGHEGYYPDLIIHCEKKLGSINPNNRQLRKQQNILQLGDLDKDEQQNLQSDIKKWSEQMTEQEPINSGQNIFTPSATNQQVNGFGDHDNLPPIRGTHVLKGGTKKKMETGDSKVNSKRIKSSDYKAWEKFDVEKECEKVDENEPAAPKKTTYKIPNEIDASGLDEAEKEIKAIKEKEKGNEAFKSGDFEEALSYYCRSIALQPIAASYNNRALVYLRLEKWKEAKRDCDTVLSFEGEESNLKAMLRRATACKALGLYDEAKDDLRFVLEKEPSNARAKSILNDVEKLESAKKEREDDEKQEEDSKNEGKDSPPSKIGKKMVITEVEGDSDEEESEKDSSSQDLSKDEDSPTKIQPSNSNPESRHKKRDYIPKTQEVASEASSDKMDSPLQNQDDSRTSEKFSPPKSEPSSDKTDRAEETSFDSSSTMNDFSPDERKMTKDKDSIKIDSTESKDTEESSPRESYSDSTNKIEEVPPLPPPQPKYPPNTEILKLRAADFFKSGNYAEACEHYTKAIDSLSPHLKLKNPDFGYELASAVLHNNRAACWLKVGNDRACIDDCTKTLDIKTWDTKAFMRRATAYEHMEKYTKAWTDFQSAHSMDWQNTLAQDGANRTAKHLREMYGSKWREKVPNVPRYPQAFANYATSLKSETPKILETSQPVMEELTAQDSNQSKKVPVKVNSPPPRKKVVEKGAIHKAVDKKAEKFTGKHSKAKNSNQGRKHNKSKSKSPKQSSSGTTTKSDAELEEKRDKIRRDLYERLKSEGNDHVKNGDYKSAIERYTKCLTVCPKEPASYTNRALCFLKLKKHISAVHDCTEAIRLDPINVKAFYRRALARKAEGFFQDAERDIKKLLEIDPANKAAETELNVLKKMAWDAARAKGASAERCSETENKTGKNSPRKKQIVIEEVDSSSSSDEAEFTLPEDIEFTEINLNEKEDTGENTTPAEETSKITMIEDEIEVTDDDQKIDVNSKSSDIQKPHIEILEPTSDEKTLQKPKSDHVIRTPYEFGNAWSSILKKSNLAEYKAILDQVIPKDLPALLSNKIDDHVIDVVAKIALKHVESDGEFQRAYDMMHHLTRADRFTMAAMFLSKEEQKPVESTLEALSTHAGKTFSKEDLDGLRKAYNL